MSQDVIEYDGDRYHRGPRRYYRKKGRAEEGYLHREKWRKEKGEIPKGYHVHHKDGDPSNNNLENLELVSPQEHAEKHEDWGNPNPEEATEAAKNWHRSEEGREWHRKMAKKQWEEKEAKTKECDQCGEEFEYYTDARFCSDACKAKHRRESGKDDEERECVICGDVFEVNKYSDTETCSRSCAGKLIAERRKN